MSYIAVVLSITISLILVTTPTNGRNIKRTYPFAAFDSIDCSKFDPNYVETLKCWLTPNARGELAFNAILVFKQDLPHITCKYNLIVERNSRNLTYLSIDIDICTALGAFFQNPILRMVASEMQQVSNFPLECPLKKSVKYLINNFTLNSKYIPTFTPEIRWISNANYYTDTTEKKLFQYIASGIVTRKHKIA